MESVNQRLLASCLALPEHLVSAALQPATSPTDTWRKYALPPKHNRCTSECWLPTYKIGLLDATQPWTFDGSTKPTKASDSVMR